MAPSWSAMSSSPTPTSGTGSGRCGRRRTPWPSHPIPRTAPDETGPVRLLYAGRFTGQKNLPLLLRAAKRLRELGCRFEFHLVGGGPDEADLRQFSEREGLGGCVHFRGTVSREAI